MDCCFSEVGGQWDVVYHRTHCTCNYGKRGDRINAELYNVFCRYSVI